MLRNPIWQLVLFALLISTASCTQRNKTSEMSGEFSGSESCIDCHQSFYELWSPSHHGKAMEPMDSAYVNSKNLPNSETFHFEGKDYRVVFGASTMTMLETSEGESTEYNIIWALGGKNVSYYLTDLGGGKLQTIPLAYDHNKEMWYNNPESAVRHFEDASMPDDEALPWKDRMYNFNTSCYSCHVSQLETNFDLETDTYQTTWKEPGINCETCHGPSAEHVEVCREAEKKGKVPKDLKIVMTSTFTKEQHNSSCAPCHAQMRPITPSYFPGDRFFDNYDLTTLEHSDFYPDGRDLGETYTYTSWNQNQCNLNGELHCVTCHTSSGRDRYADNPNEACLQCHNNRNEDLTAHTGHLPESEGSVCINCHMPKTEFGRMGQSDHSFRPPMPEATKRYGSPNACNICHTDKSPEWANKIVKARTNGNYQEETMKWADLILQAKQGKWENAQEMLAIISEEKYDHVVQNSLVRLLANYNEEQKWPVLMNAVLNNSSPLVRASSAAGLFQNYSDEAKNTLIKACYDEFRVVRVAAALPLSSFPLDNLASNDKEAVSRATEEYMTSIVTRPDDWSSHYNLGIYYQNQGNADQALQSYETAANLYPEALLPLVNSSVLYSYIGDNENAEANLRKVLEMDPGNEAASLNLGLLLAELGRLDEAELALKDALKANPEGQAVAAKNLSVIVAQRGDFEQAVIYAETAWKIRPNDSENGYTLAYYQLQNNQKNKAITTLNQVLHSHPEYMDARQFLAEVYLRDGNTKGALKLYRDALNLDGISDQQKAAIQQSISILEQNM